MCPVTLPEELATSAHIPTHAWTTEAIETKLLQVFPGRTEGQSPHANSTSATAGSFTFWCKVESGRHSLLWVHGDARVRWWGLNMRWVGGG